MTIIARYLIAHYLRSFAVCMSVGLGLFFIIDFFDALGAFEGYDANTFDLAVYFLLKIPNMVREVYPAAALLAVLSSLGLLGRHREILALRSCGVSTFSLALPLICTSAVASVLMLVWNEAVVPPTAAKSRLVRDITIMNKQSSGAYNATGLWYQGEQGFFNIDYFDASRSAIFGLTVYETDSDFSLRRIYEVPTAFWRAGEWTLKDGRVKVLDENRDLTIRPLADGELELKDPPDAFRKRRQKTKEMSFAALRSRIDVLKAKGLDAGGFVVDLHAKLALPFAGFITVFVGFPLAIRSRAGAGVTSNVIAGLGVGLGYWVTMAVAMAAGRTGGIPPVLAAWAANLLFLVLGTALYVGSDS